MKKIKHYEEIKKLIKENQMIMFYASNDLCSVCQEIRPKIENIANDLNLPVFDIDITENPMARGQMTLFMAPVVMLYYEGREVHREGRFLDFEELNNKINYYKDIS